MLYVADDGQLMAVAVATTDGNLEPGAPRALFQLPAAYARAAGSRAVLMDINRDASQILVPVPVEDTTVSNLQVILNWR